MSFEFDSATRRRLGYKLIDRIDEYFSGLPDRPVQLRSELRTFDDLADKLPEFGEDAAKVLDDICSRSEEHTSELQSHLNLVCRLLLEKKTTQPFQSMPFSLCRISH